MDPWFFVRSAYRYLSCSTCCFFFLSFTSAKEFFLSFFVLYGKVLFYAFFIFLSDRRSWLHAERVKMISVLVIVMDLPNQSNGDVEIFIHYEILREFISVETNMGLYLDRNKILISLLFLAFVTSIIE